MGFIVTFRYVPIPMANAYYGVGPGPIFLDDVICNGTESNLADCRLKPWGTNNCVHGEDAGVFCMPGKKIMIRVF